MRIAVITEGSSEYKSLPRLYGQIGGESQHAIVQTMKINVSPDAAPSIIARECKSRLLIAARSGINCVVVVLDREQQSQCPGSIAAGIESALQVVSDPSLLVRVVLKDRTFENWLLADLDGLRKQPKRFAVTAAVRKKIEPNKADSSDALALIKSITIGGHYDKVPDGDRICRNLDVLRASAHSRSFRHLLHVLQHPAYSNQCRQPQ